MALMLSQWMGIFLRLIYNSHNCCIIHKSCAQHAPMAMYSTSAVDNATKFCFSMKQVIDQEIDKCLMCSFYLPYSLHNRHQNIQQERNLHPLGYKRSKFFVPAKYQKMHFTVVRWNSLEDDSRQAHKHTLNIISGQLAVKYNREPIIPRCDFSFTGLHLGS